MERTFTGAIRGLEVGSRFILVTVGGHRPHRDTATRDYYKVTRREEHRVHARQLTSDDAFDVLDHTVPLFTTYTAAPDAPLSRSE